MLLHFDGYTVEPILSLPLLTNALDFTRATVIDGVLYVITANGADFIAEPLPGVAG